MFSQHDVMLVGALSPVAPQLHKPQALHNYLKAERPNADARRESRMCICGSGKF